MKKLLFLFILSMLCLWSNINAQILITDTSQLTKIGKQTYLLEDKKSEFTFEQILTPEIQKSFTQSKYNSPNYAVTLSTVWCKFEIGNSTNQPIYLFLDNPLLDSVILYELDPNTSAYNANIILKNSSNLDGAFLYHLNLNPDQKKQYYFRINTKTSLQFPLYVGTFQSYVNTFRNIDLFHGCYYGFIIVMILYNLFIFISIREKAYIYYIVYALGIGLFHAYLNGHIASVFSIDAQLFLSNYMIVETCLTLIAIMLFSMIFLNIKVNAPKLQKGLNVFFVLVFLPAIFELAGYGRAAAQSAQSVALLISLYLLITGTYIYRSGYAAARFYLIAWVSFLTGVIIFTLALQNFIEYNSITKKAMEIGSAIEMFLISLALADRINIYKSEKLNAQNELLISSKENERLVQDQNIILERMVKERTQQLETEKKKSDDLLLNILPSEVAEELKQSGSAEAKLFDNVTVLFTDFENFTGISESLSPTALVSEIHICFKAFDEIMERYGMEKIKTIGDAYMAVCGMPNSNTNHAIQTILAAKEIIDFMKIRKQNGGVFDIRIGVNTGPVVAGIVGIKKYAYDIWGDTVNVANRMESKSETGKINISGATYKLVKNDFECIYRGKIVAKNKGEIDMYFVS